MKDRNDYYRAYRNKNRDKYNEYQRSYQRQYRAKLRQIKAEYEKIIAENGTTETSNTETN